MPNIENIDKIINACKNPSKGFLKNVSVDGFICLMKIPKVVLGIEQPCYQISPVYIMKHLGIESVDVYMHLFRNRSYSGEILPEFIRRLEEFRDAT